MKKITLLLLIFIARLGFSQNISQLRVVPPNPTLGDSVLLLADLQFNSSPCALDNKSHSIIGNTIVANTLHCVGIAGAICNTTDTFFLGFMGPGKYNVSVSLSSGGSPAPCSPGIVPSDFDTLSFTVQSGLGLIEQRISSFGVYPNPAKDFIALSNAYIPVIKSLKIRSIEGAEVLESDSPQDRIDVSGLAPGIYYIELFYPTGKITEKFIKE